MRTAIFPHILLDETHLIFDDELLADVALGLAEELDDVGRRVVLVLVEELASVVDNLHNHDSIKKNTTRTEGFPGSSCRCNDLHGDVAHPYMLVVIYPYQTRG